MRLFFDLVLFDRDKMMQMPILKKTYSYLYVISLVLVTSLLVVVLKTTNLDLDQLKENIAHLDSMTEISNLRIYQDGLNTINIDNDIIIINGNEIISVSKIQKQFGLNNFKDVQLLLSNNERKISFVFFIYEYLISFKYLILFIFLLTVVSLASKYQLKIAHEITLKETLTYTSYILTIPILISAFLRLLNFRFSYAVMILVVLTIILEFLFSKHYVAVKSKI